MEGYKCDRCGAFETPDHDEEQYKIVFSYAWEVEDATIDNRARNAYDLCNECRSELVDWVELNDE